MQTRLDRRHGFSFTELLAVISIILILSAVSVPFLFRSRNLYRSEDQALRIMDLMQEANQLALNRRRTVRLEIDLTDNAVLLIDENGSPNGPILKSLPLEPVEQIRMDTNPTGISAPNPPGYANAVFATDTLGHTDQGTSVIGHQVWAARFRSDGSVVTATGAPVSGTVFLWPPDGSGSSTARNNKEIRAITMFGGSGAVRYWRYTGSGFQPY